ncbi:hypothetical protein EON66_07300 [archaeon]|nr:MAG: hypothetical protein EON66_07300 [archaeon]
MAARLLVLRHAARLSALFQRVPCLRRTCGCCARFPLFAWGSDVGMSAETVSKRRLMPTFPTLRISSRTQGSGQPSAPIIPRIALPSMAPWQGVITHGHDTPQRKGDCATALPRCDGSAGDLTLFSSADTRTAVASVQHPTSIMKSYAARCPSQAPLHDEGAHWRVMNPLRSSVGEAAAPAAAAAHPPRVTGSADAPALAAVIGGFDDTRAAFASRPTR